MAARLVCTVIIGATAREVGVRYRVRLSATSGRGSAFKDFPKKKQAEAFGQKFVAKAIKKRKYSASYTVKKITPDIAWIYK